MAAPTPSSVRTGTTSDASAPRASFDGAESFRTADSVEVGYFRREGEGGTPELVRDDDETVTSLASPVTGGSGSAVGMQEAFGAGGGKLGREQEEEQVERLRM